MGGHTCSGLCRKVVSKVPRTLLGGGIVCDNDVRRSSAVVRKPLRIVLR